MNRLALLLILLSSAVLGFGCTAAQVSSDETPTESTADSAASQARTYVVDFRDRRIDLEPYVQGFPFSQFQPDVEHGHMLYFETTPQGKWLYFQDLATKGEIDLRAGRKLNDIDWSTRSFWGGVFHRPSQRFLVRADERNDERINLYWMDLATGALEQTTDNDYTYAFGLSEDHSSVAYVARHGTKEPFNSCLYVRDLTSGDERKVLCDEGGSDRFTWSNVEYSPDRDFVIVTVQHDGDRNTTNLARIDLMSETPAFEFLLERGTKHFRLGTTAKTVSHDGLIYWSAKSGFDNLYRYDWSEKASTALTEFEDEMASAVYMKNDEQAVLTVVLRRPYESEILVLDPESGGELYREQSDDSLSISSRHAMAGVITASSVASPFRMDRFTLESADGAVRIVRSRMAGVPGELARRIIHCNVERVSYPTFDKLADAAPRMLHAYLLTPRNPPTADKRLVRMTSFYGGGNHFSTGTQIMCEAGVATFSPAPRGSSGFGANFAALNDGDLGGDEIIDLFYGARFLEQEYGYTASQIGVHGGSHGGYATMRALTFPPETNKRDEAYAFGFGISHAGFSDILSFFETCNIPDWVILEAGNPATEADKLRDRSPLTHVERLAAPILLTHGENDSRVPVAESRRFAERASELGRPVTYVEFAGQGHGIDGLDNTLHYYRVVFDFLAQKVDPQLVVQSEAD
ncbi:MAG: S9 family peptidase [Bradymonadaceae bacterium]|nr:S9 family peptidase [Lujinxingiaceae bacterium]